MKTSELAELYKSVLRLEEQLVIIQEEESKKPKTDGTSRNKKSRRYEEASEALAAARSAFSNAVVTYNRTHRNIPFYRKSKTFSVKLKRGTVKFYFDQRGIATIVNSAASHG